MCLKCYFNPLMLLFCEDTSSTSSSISINATNPGNAIDAETSPGTTVIPANAADATVTITPADTMVTPSQQMEFKQ